MRNKYNKNLILTLSLVVLFIFVSGFLIVKSPDSYGKSPLASSEENISQKLVLGETFEMNYSQEEEYKKKEEARQEENSKKKEEEPPKAEERYEESQKLREEQNQNGETDNNDATDKKEDATKPSPDESQNNGTKPEDNQDSADASPIDNDDPNYDRNPAERPIVKTSIKNNEKVSGNLYKFTVETTDYKGKWLSGFYTNVYVNGKRVYPEERDKIVEYRLDEKDLVNGANTIDVVGKDENGNIKKLRYTIHVNLDADKVVAGYVTVTARADSIGLGKLFTRSVKMFKDESPAFVVKRAFEESGYEVLYVKNTKYGFYIKGIRRSGLKNGWHFSPAVEKRLKDYYGDEALYQKSTKPGDLNTLKEFDFKGTSGWMFYSNGTMANYGLSGFPLSPGDRISIVFSLDFGKEYQHYNGSDGWTDVAFPIE